ncbi:hypothetical protein DL96DRAFT_1814259 [Flagelloscypha sp. PMI_526]|nr:hypothetical protein DL96DRAFT_1814259 [Flagelloscypha sp. PMI_526]
MTANHDLPIDILRLLFQFSASSSVHCALALSLVSKEVQRWTDPYLFEIVHKTGPNFSWAPKTSLLDQMLESEASPRIVFARNYVRTLAWDQYVFSELDVEDVLETFLNLTELCIWGNVFPYQVEDSPSKSFEITKGYPSLRKLSSCIRDRWMVPPSAFNSPFWMTITHLQLRYMTEISSSESAFQLPLFVPMTSLTHLALLAFTGVSESNTDHGFSLVRKTFPPSLILCLLAVTSPPLDEHRGNWIAQMVDASLNIDKRIVICWTNPTDNVDVMAVKSHDFDEAWCRIQDRGQSLWEMGEAVLKGRHEQLSAI